MPRPGPIGEAANKAPADSVWIDGSKRLEGLAAVTTPWRTHRPAGVRLMAAFIVVALGGCGGSSVSATASSSIASTPPTSTPISLTYAQAMHLFEYDRARPFDTVERSSSRRNGATIHDLRYAGAAGGRRQALLVIPSGAGPFGGVLYLHGAGGDSSSYLDEALDLASRGVAALLVNQPEAQAVPLDADAAVNEIVFEMRELGRDLDLLASRPEIDPARLGFVGFSFGAVRGATFAGSQGGRLRIAVLDSLPPRYNAPGMEAFDPIAWVPHVSPAMLYLQEGRQDAWFTAAEAESLIAAAREPKKLVWYEADHGLNDQAYRDRLGWLSEILG
jgi:dienelactone hydrolase